jgi:type VI secretion system protein ImpC
LAWVRAPAYDARRPRVAGSRREEQDEITVSDVPGAAGWYKVDLQVRPHFKYMGAYFNLNLVGKLDKE